MPELPEVETTVRDLSFINGLFIKKIKLYRKDIRYPIPNQITTITKNSKILKIIRIAKYIVINLDNFHSIIIHLGMSGRLKVLSNFQSKEKHDHVDFILNNKNKITFNDPRRFGIIDIIKTDKIFTSKYFINQGLDPFNKNFDSKYIYEVFKKSNSNLKCLLMKQSLICGIGNIYASEILFDSRISPLKKGKNITVKESKRIYRSIRKVLLLAIKNRGSSLKDYSTIYGTLGNYQNQFKVYNNEGKYIKINMLRAKIIKITQSGRSTFYCPYLQRIKKK